MDEDVDEGAADAGLPPELPLTLNENQQIALDLLMEMRAMHASIRATQRKIVAKAHEALSYAIDADVTIVQKVDFLGDVMGYTLCEESSFLEFDVDEWIYMDPLKDVVHTDDERAFGRMGDLICECAWSLGAYGDFRHRSGIKVASQRLAQESAIRDAYEKTRSDPNPPIDLQALQAVLDARDAADAESEAAVPPDDVVLAAAA